MKRPCNYFSQISSSKIMGVPSNTVENFNINQMKTNGNQNQIVITTTAEDEKQKLPLNILLTLAAGAIAGMAVIFGLFWGAEKLLGL